MTLNDLKTYAPEARRQFIQAVTDRAAWYGVTADTIEPIIEEGDVTTIDGRAVSKDAGAKRRGLETLIKKRGFAQTIEAMAYTWFNRLVAIRYMELKGYLDHGYRVLSHSEGRSLPEIVEHAEHVELPDLDSQKVIELKLDGTKEEELFRMLLIAQCNALHQAMPFLFEAVDDSTELLLPDNLLHSESLMRKLVNEIDEEDWQEVEILGWLYQFYISEKKNAVIGTVVKREDIPAATQLFTPNWIVKYLVQNTLGRRWLATYPNSPLRRKMESYIEPVEQTAQVQAAIVEISPENLNPEDLTLLDPACGSGHILVEAYDLLKTIYLERGYRPQDIPRLILEQNLYGLEIDDRAAQLAAFVLMMKARGDDRCIFERDVRLNVLSIQEGRGLNARNITAALNTPLKNCDSTGTIAQADVAHLIELFEQGKTFGSLIRVPSELTASLPAIARRVIEVIDQGGPPEKVQAARLRPLVCQGQLLAAKYDEVVANPPYMGAGLMGDELKAFGRKIYPEAKSDLCTLFMLRALDFCHDTTSVGMVTMHSWMFLSSFEVFRRRLLSQATILSMAHLGPRAFSAISGEVVQTTAFVCGRKLLLAYRPTFLRLLEGGESDKHDALRQKQHCFTRMQQSDFLLLPTTPIVYWISAHTLRVFSAGTPLASLAEPRQGLITGNNDQFVRYWHEPSSERVEFNVAEDTRNIRSLKNKRWFPYNKGGPSRKWYGNLEHVVNWEDDGSEVRHFGTAEGGRQRSRPQNTQHYFRSGITWSAITGGQLACRRQPTGVIFSNAGMAVFGDEPLLVTLEGLINSCVGSFLLGVINPTINFGAGDIGRLPILNNIKCDADAIESLEQKAMADWNESESSWDFQSSPLLPSESIKSGFDNFVGSCAARLQDVCELERKNNKTMIECYGFSAELSPEVAEESLSLYRPGREEDSKRLISYSIGCMMGRYSLDKPGLIYARSDNRGFDPANYRRFPAVDDGIIPLTEYHWFDDDVADRIEQFIVAAWPEESLEGNLEFVAESLFPGSSESPRNRLRRYLATDFYKHHLARYKRRPIYWLFSSGRLRGFQAIVYLHRYNEGTLTRMRTEYVTRLLGKMSARLEYLQGPGDQDGQRGEIGATTSAIIKRKLEKERDTIKKQRAEVQAFDAKLRHYADQRLLLNLDDGVRVNYRKFGDLLAEVKAVT